MSSDLAQFQQVLWAVNAAATVFLLVLLVVRGNYRSYPIFPLYILANLTLGGLAFLVYRWLGFSSPLLVLWNLLERSAFFASLLVWIWVLRETRFWHSEGTPS